MGSCFSSTANAIAASTPAPTAKVITLAGSLVEYSSPVTVLEVLGAEICSVFLCDSDMLFDGAYIPPLHSGDFIEPDKIYFLLPITKLQYLLTGSDMAALAVRASIALATASKKTARRRRIRVVPVEKIERKYNGSQKFEERTVWVSRTTIRSRISSRKGRVKYVPFEPKLSTIAEETM